MDIAASIQKVAEEIMLRSVRYVHRETGMKNLCLAGGVALNCVGNGRILREGPFENVWVQPAAGDAGGALGVALFIWYQLLDNERVANPDDGQFGSLLGREYSDVEIEEFLQSVNATYEHIEDDVELCDNIADEIDAGKVIGWYQGRMEFGPRALGSRSILADARNPQMQSTINLKVKFREGFRPFAPVVLEEHAHEYFHCEKGQGSPYMLFVAPVQEKKRKAVPPELSNIKGLDLLMQERSVIPSVTHVDYSARMQTVDAKRHGLLRQLMEVFYQKTGCPVMVNTSFNLGWDPIVATPQDAYTTFMACGIDTLCMGHYVLRKSNQPATVHQVNDPAYDEVLDNKLVSPCCRATLTRNGSDRVCTSCGYRFKTDGNIPQMFWPHEQIEDPKDVTVMVKAFYEKTPFPNYNDHDSIYSLIDKSRKGIYARTLDQSIAYNTDVLEVGCGTGQLTNFLGSSCRRVIGTDMCLNSLKLGEAFRQDQGLNRVRFLQMNLFRTALCNEQFDLVICNGVLHHTADPYGGFKSILQLVKPGGHILIALYNRYGRLATDIRRFLFRLTGGRARWIDPILRQKGLSQGRQSAWFADQYQHPHESKHTIGEVLKWFDENDLEFASAVPSARPFSPPLGEQNIFEPGDRGTAWDHFIVQTKEIISNSREGGFFVMIARKPDNR
ncbi:MAG: carbamoyltransferase C-terminal domain-containing protein, partial [Thermodesulfobacteriota bacterium]|nr:carbamoyltransferase C-terminal domain-containing protein [Thermodesulfobacteriota bacterium]